ncbi:hypothetical protein ACHAQH_007917, partial [Verticillium albo-atrum]
EFERRQAAKLLDLGLTNTTNDNENQEQTFNGKAPVHHKRPNLAVLPISESANVCQQAPAQVFILMTVQEAHCLPTDFIDNPVHLLPPIHRPKCSIMIEQLYGGLGMGEPPRNYLAYASLVLAIAATSAFYYHPGSTIFGMFDTPEHAANVAMKWVRASLDLADLSHREAPTFMEAVQARVILGNLLYSTEGSSSRCRFVQHSSILLGREIGLHLLDSPRTHSKDDATTKEIKRRLWWYIVSAD